MIRQLYSNGVIYRDENNEFVSGRGAGFPSEVPPDGALFWRQDYRAFYAWNRTGTGWELVDTGGGGGGAAISAGAESQSTGTVIFSNSNGVSFGLNAGTLTASVDVGGGGLTNIRVSAGTTSNLLSALTFANAANVSFGLDAGTITAAFQQSIQTQDILLGVGVNGGAVSSSQIQFSNGNGVTFGGNASTITASVKTDYLTTAQPPGAYLTTARASNDAVGLNTAATQVTWTVNSAGISLDAGAYLTTAQPPGAYLTTAMASNRGSDFVQATAAFAGTSASGTIASGGISVSIGPYITTGMLSNAATISNIRVSAGTTSNLLSALTFADSNGVSFGINASTITATVKTDYLTTAALSDHSHGASAAAGSFAFQTLSFSNVNGISFGTSAGPAITASHNALTSQSNQAFSADASSTFQTLSFQNSNNVSFSNNAGAIRVTHNLAGTGTAITGGASITLNSTGLSFNGTALAGTVTAATNATLTLNSAGLSISVAGPGAAAITQSIGMSTQTAGGGTDGTTGYVTGDDILYHFVPGSNITMSQSVNGASGTLSIYGPAAGGGATLSGWNPWPQPCLWVLSGIGNASLYLRAVDVPFAFQYDRFVMPIHFSQATNSTLSVSNSMAWGWYSRNANTLSLYKSGSGTFSINGSGTDSSGANSGIRLVSLASTDTITAGNYYLGVVWRTSSAGQNASLSYIAASQWASTISGFIGVTTNTRMAYHPAGGVWTSTTQGPVPASIAFSDIRGNSSAFQRQPVCHFTSGGVNY